ncbi:hypothetical protein EV207_12218 [Scopulibacillus darangshiensis]|uniref:Lipoprotein n=1 Tax=Scopulibacillus darangshiensis TaxID=442528 RepID=A0A4R2NU56_9BACL|nr:hypothetical protein [Scopulibacillus darangshiensis]TCP24915.1 hypothetical protein EV207_12218 [Scopulibacillus darangshiensis]
MSRLGDGIRGIQRGIQIKEIREARERELKKLIFALAAVLLFGVVLAGCGSDKTSSNNKKNETEEKKAEASKGKKHLNADEKMVLKFIAGYDSEDEDTRVKAVDDYVADETKDIYKLGAAAPPEDKKSDYKVIESIKQKEDGKEATLVLLHSLDDNKELHESIFAVMNHKVLFSYSPESSDQEMRKAFKDLRSNFKTPVPEAVKKQMKEQAASEKKSKYPFPSDTTAKGNGKVVIETPAGSSENGNVPVLFVDKNTSFTQTDIDLSNFEGDKQTYIYVNKKFVQAEQVGEETATTLDLEGDLLKPGIYTVTAVQFKDNDPTKEVIGLASTKFEIKEGA